MISVFNSSSLILIRLGVCIRGEKKHRKLFATNEARIILIHFWFFTL